VRQEKQEDGKQRRKGEGAEMLKRIPEKKRELIRALVQSGMPYRNVSEEMNVSVGVVNKIMREGEDILPLAAEVRKRWRRGTCCWPTRHWTPSQSRS
jgi:DNA-directed RNA polymerase specialized sigma24 family protein